VRARAGVEDERLQVAGHRDGDLGNQVACGARQRSIAMPGHPLCAEGRRFDLVGGEHQRRQVEAAFQHVANAGLTADGNPLPDQRGDVAINRAFRGLELDGHGRRGDRRPGSAQDLDDLEQPVATSHGSTLAVAC
jgi:hypothetical protein